MTHLTYGPARPALVVSLATNAHNTGATMTPHAKSRLTRFAFAFPVAVAGALIVVGVITGGAVPPKSVASTAVSGIEINELMSNVDATKLPTTEISDLF